MYAIGVHITNDWFSLPQPELFDGKLWRGGSQGWILAQKKTDNFWELTEEQVLNLLANETLIRFDGTKGLHDAQ